MEIIVVDSLDLTLFVSLNYVISIVLVVRSIQKKEIILKQTLVNSLMLESR